MNGRTFSPNPRKQGKSYPLIFLIRFRHLQSFVHYCLFHKVCTLLLFEIVERHLLSSVNTLYYLFHQVCLIMIIMMMMMILLLLLFCVCNSQAHLLCVTYDNLYCLFCSPGQSPIFCRNNKLPCVDNAVCTNNRCTCDTGFHGDGRVACRPSDRCKSQTSQWC